MTAARRMNAMMAMFSTTMKNEERSSAGCPSRRVDAGGPSVTLRTSIAPKRGRTYPGSGDCASPPGRWAQFVQLRGSATSAPVAPGPAEDEVRRYRGRGSGQEDEQDVDRQEPDAGREDAQ